MRLKPEWLLIASGLWLRAGFVGASAFVSGFITLWNGQAAPAFAWSTIIAGAAVGVFAVRRARQALNRLASPTPPRRGGAAAETTSPFPRSPREAPAR
jgi:hypothetical protein